LQKAGQVLELAPDWFIHNNSYRDRLNEAAARIQQASSSGQSLSLSISDFRKGLSWPGTLWNRIQEDLEARNLVTRRGDRFVLEAAVDRLGDEDRDLMERMLAIYDEHGFQAPRPDEVAEKLKIQPAEVERLLDLLCNREKLFRLTKNVVLSYDWLKRAQEMVIGIIAEKGSLDSAEFKYNLKSTRKYALAILDFLDARRVTVRSGNIRTLASDYRRNQL
jgi:selenocysteine-specific elongation factor